MSHRVSPVDQPLNFEVDGETVTAQAGDTVASAFIGADRTTLSRSVKYHRPRGPFCLSGGCAQCLVRIDGVPNQYACQTAVKAGLRVERQNGFPDASVDVLQASDLVFQKWFNHHEFLAGVPLVEKVLLQVARKLSGLGVLPDHGSTPPEPAVSESVEIAIVGGGAAGLSAARALSFHQAPFVLFEREPVCGGRLLTGTDLQAPAPELPTGGWTRTGASIVGLFADDDRPFLAAVQRNRLHLVFYRQLLLANGGQPTLLTFANNDLPGVYASRAVSRLIRKHGVVPGRRIAVVGEPTEARSLAALISSVGAEPVAVGAEPLRAHGLRAVQAITVARDGKTEKVDCDAIALCAPLTPAFELARAAGARVSWDPRAKVFAVQADEGGECAPNTWVAGEVRGPMSAATAAEQGRLAAEAIVRARSAR